MCHSTIVPSLCRDEEAGVRRVGQSSPPEIRSLTGLRGMAAMLVVIHHFWLSGDFTTNWLKWSIGRGYLWVDFFVLK
jgi:peptidoglycan/LPS O-acetylase OafA/YrhL